MQIVHQHRKSPYPLGRSRRFTFGWLLVAAALTVVITFLTIFRVNFRNGLSVTFRQQQTWQATERILVTSAVNPTSTVAPRRTQPSISRGKPTTPQPAIQIGGPLPPTVLMSQLANSTVVRQLVLKAGPLHGHYTASPLVSRSSTQSHVIQIAGIAHSASQARIIATRASNALRSWLQADQMRARIPRGQMILLKPVSIPTHSTLLKDRNLVLPLAISTILLTLLGLAAITTAKTRPAG